MEKTGRKAADDLLAFQGRPSLLYPAVRSPADDSDADSQGGFPARLASGLGTAKFLLGACLALLGGMAVYVQAWSSWTYGGIWSGLFAIFTGLCVILAARRHRPDRKSLLVALLVLSVLGFFNTGLLATFTAMGLVAEIYAEDVAGGLVWKGVENASPFAVQVLLLATATADSLLSLACCVISGREVCCCGRPAPAVVNVQRRDRLIRWLGSQGPPTPQLAPPTVKLVPSVRAPRRSRPKTPSTMRVFESDPSDSPPSSSSGAGSAHLNVPLVRADELGRKRRVREEETRPQPILAPLPVDIGGTMRRTAPFEEKYFALDKKLSEEFIDRTWKC